MLTRSLAFGLLLGCILSTQAALLSPTNATWRFQRGLTEASTPDLAAWRGSNFVDNAFSNAPAPFWYGDVRPGGTQLTDMLNTYTCIFLRRFVNVTNAADISGFTLNYFIDDGFILWVNGVEIYRENVTGDPTIATLAANQPTDPAPLVTRLVAVPPGTLLNGSNLIAVQVFNTSTNSSDLGFDCSLDSILIETNRPVLIAVNPPPGSNLTNVTQVTVRFSENVGGVNADDLLINSIAATNVSGSGSNYTFTFAPPTPGTVFFTWNPPHGIGDTSFPPNPFDHTAPGATWSYMLDDFVPPTMAALFPPGGARVRSLSRIEVTFSEEVNGVTASDLRINGQPASSVTRPPGGPYLFDFAPPVPGLVTVEWIPAHGITDQAVPPNAFAGGSWNYTLDSNAPLANLVINEINAANQSGLLDEDGNPQDWIEILNQGTTPVNLSGWSLSDDAAVPGLWVFPSKTLAAGEFIVVFASGLDRQMPPLTNRFHSNFQLSGAGEFLGLFTPDSPRELASGYSPEFPAQRNDHSFGRDLFGVLRYFDRPTPGGPNGASSIHGVVEPVHFSSGRGHYTQPFNLALTCATPGAQIRFTTDGSVPTLNNGQIYRDPLRVTNTLFLRAGAFRTNLLPSLVESHSYFFNQTAVIRSLPVLSIQTASNNLIGPSGIIGMSPASWTADAVWPGGTPGPNDYHNPNKFGIAWERPMSVELINPADNSGFQIDCGMRVQGSDWTRPRYQANSKFSYRLYFRGDYNASRLEYPLFNDSVIESFDQIVLRAGHNDISNPFLVDELMRQLAADTGQVAMHGNWVNFFLNGVYKGYYNPCERVEETFLQQSHGGGTSWDIITVGSAVQGGDAVEWNSLRTYANNNDSANPAVFTELSRRLDLVNFIDYLLVNAYGGTWDWPQNNWRAARERAPGGKFRFYVWDAEGAFAENGGGGRAPGSYSTFASDLLPGTAEIPMLYRRMTNSAEFRLLWADRVHKHFFNNGALTETNVAGRFLQMRSELAGVIASMDSSILNEWVPQRRAGLFSQFNLYGLAASTNAPVFNQHGGRVAPGFALSMMTTNVGGTIYYTTNGDDPRVLFTGAVSNTAVAYVAPLVLNQGLRIKARTLNPSSQWSALTEAIFDVGYLGLPLRVTEIMYNPLGGSPYEFIELHNLSGAVLDLANARVEDAISFIFPIGSMLAPDARIVLANDTDPSAWAARYPGVVPFGYFSGNLGNGGERITVRDAAGQIVVTVDYGDSGGWPMAADGFGNSLELNDPFGDPDNPANWRASAAINGTPGAASASPPPPSVRLNEILALNTNVLLHAGTRPDFIELHNSGGSSVSLAGWSLSDNGTAGQFTFPAGTSIGAGGFLIAWCDSTTNTSPGLHTGFELDPDGDRVLLFNNLNALVDVVTFGRQVADCSVGRVGGSGAWQLTSVSTNAPNVATALAPASDVVLNEWLPNPPSGLPDWLEVYNKNATLPAALQGMSLSSTTGVHRIASLSFLPPLGFLQLFADEAVGPDHLDFKLTAAGGTISLYDTAAVLLQSVNYTALAESSSQGRLPDGTGSPVSFPSTASPEAPNYTAAWTGPILNEILARNVSAITNAGRVPDYIELFNPTIAPFQLGGLSLSVGSAEAGEWTFPPGASIGASSFLIVWCDGGRAASTNAGDYNTGRSLDANSGGVFLFNTNGQAVSSVVYGPQVVDRSIGLNSGQWRLLHAPTPGSANSIIAAVGQPGVLRLNEWMANPVSGADWLEVHNPTNFPIDLSGLILTDDLSFYGTNQFRVPPLSFIGVRGFVRWIADGDPEQGRDHAAFNLDASGESLRLYTSNGLTVIDTVTFGAQSLGVSEGRLVDGSTNIVRFPGSASPGGPNYVVAPGVVINEILTHTDPPLEDFVELRNLTTNALPIGGWFLSNTEDNFKKYRIADGTSIPANGLLVFTASQFNTGPNAFAFNSAHGDQVWLSAADAAGNLSGLRVGASFGAAFDGVAFGRYPTSLGVDYPALLSRTPNTPNDSPRVGPVVINEIMYHPPVGPSAEDEFIELFNNASTNVALFDPARATNTWKLAGGVDFTFPGSVTLTPGAYALVVGFNPADTAALAAFRARNSVPASIPVYGPCSGKLDNAGDTIELLQPDPPQPVGAPDAGFVPYVIAERVAYGANPPWPSGAVDGGGRSLQRIAPAYYGNEPLHWVASTPTPGALNSLVTEPPSITTHPQNVTLLEGAAHTLTAAATGDGPITWQWRRDSVSIPNATNATHTLDFAVAADTGFYEAIASNPGGSAFSQSAFLRVVVPPEILTAPTNVAVTRSNNVSFAVTARGDAPLLYQWRKDGLDLAGQTNATLVRSNVQPPDAGAYEVMISNSAGTASASATLTVLVPPIIVLQPQSQTIYQGDPVTLTIGLSNICTGPFNFVWRSNSLVIASNHMVTSFSNSVTIFNVPPIASTLFRYRCDVQSPVQPPQGLPSANALITTITTVDRDLDGLNDPWEQRYGLSTNNAADAFLDPDGDAMINLHEFQADTVPTNALSVLRVTDYLLSASETFNFLAVSNRTYSVLTSGVLPGMPWASLTNISATAGNRTIRLTNPPPAESSRFLRLVTPQQP